jgi:hypothetical protein
MCIVIITLPVQSQVNERSCVFFTLHYLYKGKWEVMCIFSITLPVQSQVNDRSCVLLPLHYLYKARKMSGHVDCYHYTTCAKPGQWAVMCIVIITLPVQSQVNERSCVLFPLHYLYKPRKWPVMVIVTIGNNTHDRSFSWLCTGSVMVTIHMTAHCPGFVQVV